MFSSHCARQLPRTAFDGVAVIVPGNLVGERLATTGVSLTWLLCGGYTERPPSAVPLAPSGKPLPPITRH